MNPQGYQTTLNPSDLHGEFNAIQFLVDMMLSSVRTAALVQVKKCSNTGGVTAVGTVDVQPMVNQVDGFGNAVPNGILYSLPYFRLQGGANAVIMDPQVGDIGFALFADRDSTRVVNTKKEGNPGSGRRFSMADGIYVGGILNAVPQQYVQFSSSGIEVVSPSAVTIKAPAVNIENAGTALSALLNATLLNWLETHVHTAAGSPTSAPTTMPPSTVQTTVLQAE